MARGMSIVDGTRAAPLEAAALRATVRAFVGEKRYDDAWGLLRPHLLRDSDATLWAAAQQVLAAGGSSGWKPHARRTIRLGVLCTYEATELAAHRHVACRAFGIEAAIYAAPYGQLEQEVLARGSSLAAFEPTHVLVA